MYLEISNQAQSIKMTDYLNLQEIAKRIKELQEKSGMTAKDFSAETEIPASTLSQINNGKIPPSVENINKIIAKWSHLISPSWLLFGVEEQAHSPNSIGSASVATGELELFRADQGADNRLRDTLVAQAEEIGRLKATIESNKPKEIAHITVFYTDNSFATFSLNESE